jgi:hypothetical protein
MAQPHDPLLLQQGIPKTQAGHVDALHAPLEEPLLELLLDDDDDELLDVLPSSPASSPGEASSPVAVASSPLPPPVLELRPMPLLLDEPPLLPLLLPEELLPPLPELPGRTNCPASPLGPSPGPEVAQAKRDPAASRRRPMAVDRPLERMSLSVPIRPRATRLHPPKSPARRARDTAFFQA